jgi:hypothetical protein
MYYVMLDDFLTKKATERERERINIDHHSLTIEQHWFNI